MYVIAHRYTRVLGAWAKMAENKRCLKPPVRSWEYHSDIFSWHTQHQLNSHRNQPPPFYELPKLFASWLQPTGNIRKRLNCCEFHDIIPEKGLLTNRWQKRTSNNFAAAPLAKSGQYVTLFFLGQKSGKDVTSNSNDWEKPTQNHQTNLSNMSYPSGRKKTRRTQNASCVVFAHAWSPIEHLEERHSATSFRKCLPKLQLVVYYKHCIAIRYNILLAGLLNHPKLNQTIIMFKNV